jgi:hypothetical protein
MTKTGRRDLRTCLPDQREVNDYSINSDAAPNNTLLMYTKLATEWYEFRQVDVANMDIC